MKQEFKKNSKKQIDTFMHKYSFIYPNNKGLGVAKRNISMCGQSAYKNPVNLVLAGETGICQSIILFFNFYI